MKYRLEGCIVFLPYSIEKNSVGGVQYSEAVCVYCSV